MEATSSPEMLCLPARLHGAIFLKTAALVLTESPLLQESNNGFEVFQIRYLGPVSGGYRVLGIAQINFRYRKPLSVVRHTDIFMLTRYETVINSNRNFMPPKTGFFFASLALSNP
jgi:hypothetical protein